MEVERKSSNGLPPSGGTTTGSEPPSNPPRPVSTTSSQLSFSDRERLEDDGGGDADEDNSISLPHHNYPPSSTCSSSFNLHRQSSSEGGHHENKPVMMNGNVSHAPLIANSRTTTISTIAMESNTSATSKCSPTRLVIALLQTPHHGLHLKIIELSPSLLKLPDNFVEAEDFLKNHSQVIKNLQSKQSPVEELLRQADSLIATQKPRAEVYAAMAESLGQTWKDLNAILDERRVVLELAYECHKVIQCCVERMNELHSEYSKFSYIPAIEEQYVQGGKPQDVAASLRKLKEDRAQVLKLVSQALDACQQLLNKITDFNFSIDSRQLYLKRDVDFATKQVHRWLERLHDRRMILEERLKIKKDQFEEMAEILIHDKEMSGLLQELERLRKWNEEFSLGHSVESAESQRDELEKMVKEMKALQERTLLTARKLEVDERESKAKGKMYHRSGIKQKIYDILGSVNDLITESIDLELSLVDAKEFFHLAHEAGEKLDQYCMATSSPPEKITREMKQTQAKAKSQLDSLLNDALGKGQVLLESLGWDAPRTRGVRSVYDELSKRKAVIQEQIDHLELLDEYNHFLESLNQAYQNLLSFETCTLRQPKCVPVEPHLVSQFRSQQEQMMNDLKVKANFKDLLSTLENLYPRLSEEEKMSTEEKVNELKSLSNVLMELLIQRTWLCREWQKVLELDKSEWGKLSKEPSVYPEEEVPMRVEEAGKNIQEMYEPIRKHLEEVHRTDPDLITNKMEEKLDEILRRYRDFTKKYSALHKIRDICQTYKVKLDDHLLGKPESSSTPSTDPCYFPALQEGATLNTLRSEERGSKGLERVRRELLEQKLNSTLANFFQPLITNFRQEILKAQEEAGALAVVDKTPEEISWERYFERLKESYVTVTKGIGDYLGFLQGICKEVEDTKTGVVERTSKVNELEVGEIEKVLQDLNKLRSELSGGGRMEKDVGRRLEEVVGIVGREEPPREAQIEERTLRALTKRIIEECVNEPLNQMQDHVRRQLTEKMIHNDLDMINGTLNELIKELEHPCNYGNNLKDAETYFKSFERFEKTVETLRDKLSRLLTTAGMSETDLKAENLLGKLNLLVDRKAKRRELILMSLEYFRLIEQSYEHYDKVNSELQDIIDKSKAPNLTIEGIESLLKRLEKIKGKESEQEKRLDEIERISKIIFDVSQEEETRQHYPLRDRSQTTIVEITRVESDLTSLLSLIRSQSEAKLKEVPKETKPTAPPPDVGALSELELELMSHFIPEKKPEREKLQAEKVRSLATEAKKDKDEEPKEVIEELIVPTRVVRPRSSEISTQTSSGEMDLEELEAKTQEYLKEKERMTMAVLEALRQSMSPLPSAQPPQTVEKETQFEDLEEVSERIEKVDRDTITQTIRERLRSFETQTEERVVTKGVEMGTGTDDELGVEDVGLLLEQTMLQQNQGQRPQSREYTDPMFIQPLKDLVVNEGDKVVLECKTTGRIQKLVWLKDGLEIVNNPDYKTDFLDGSTATLTIDEALQEDSAIFTCRAFGEGEGPVMVETSGRLTIREPVTSTLLPPRFLPHPPVSTGEHGKPHVIQLKVEGNPLPTVQWFKEGQGCIDTSPDYIITFNNGLCEVQFDELVKDMDDGVYTCVAINKLGDAETKVELQIKGDVDISKKLSRQPPRITQPLPKNLMSRAGQKVKLECEFESPTDFTVVWVKDDNKILTPTNSSAEIITEGTTSKLVFNEAYPINSGKYTVLIRNAGGECQSDCQIIVKGLLPAETSDSELNVSDGEAEAVKPTIKMPLKDVTGRVGQKLLLDCVIVGSPEPEVIWYKNGVPLKESPNHHLLFHGDKCSLVIDHADLGDNGIYSVSALNNCGEASSKCQVFVFERSPEFTEPKAIEAPKFAKIIQDEMVIAGHEFTFTVELAPSETEGVETDVTWFKNNSQITPNPRVEITKEGPVHQLHFKEVHLCDKGNYMVKAVNPGGDTKCFGCLIVKENFEKDVAPAQEQEEVKEEVKEAQALPPPQVQKQVTPPSPKKPVVTPRVIVKSPRFVIPLEGKMVDEGNRGVCLKCKIDASPPASVKWTKNNGVDGLEPGPDSNMSIRYNEKSGEAELNFSAVHVNDGGRYTCHASNEHGVASSVADLIVKKTTFPPVFSKRLQSLNVEPGKRIYFEVDVFGKPAPEVKWYLNGAPLVANDAEGVSIRSDTPTRHCLIVASAKKDKYAGEYQVVARNEAGEASSSCIVSIVGPDGQGVTTTNVPIEVIFTPTTTSMKTSSVQQGRSSTVRDESSLVESTTIITSTEEHLYETRVTEVISPVPSAELDSLTVKRAQPSPIPKSAELVIKSAPSKEVVIIPQPKPSPVETKDDSEQLVPGSPPEILVAPVTPSTTVWSKSKNQVLEKVKKFEEETSESEAPTGGVRIIPINKVDAQPPPPQQQPSIQQQTPIPIIPTNLGDPIQMMEAPKLMSSPIMMMPPSPMLEGYKLMEPPKLSHDATSTVSRDSYKIGDAFVSTEERHESQQSSRAVKYIKPTKFVPEKMRESDHDSEVESTVIPPKWVPPPVKTSTSTTTSSAFVPVTPPASMTTTSTTWNKQTYQSQPAPPTSTPCPAVQTEPSGVKSFAKLWPPTQSSTLETSQTTTFTSQQSSSSMMSSSSTEYTSKSLKAPSSGPQGQTCLSPIGFGPERTSCRSPTPNREALEMDKLWSRPIRFSSPVTVPSTSIPTTSSSQSPIPPPTTLISPTSTLRKGPKPEPPPKPQSSSSSWLKRTTPTPFSPVHSPIPSAVSPGLKPEVPPKPSYLKTSPLASPSPHPPSSRPGTSASNEPSSKEPYYFVSTVSTPRTTPVPPQLGWTSPLPTTPEVPPEQQQQQQSYSSTFHEKRELFESSTTSYSTFEETSTSSQKQFSSKQQSSSSSTSQQQVHPSGVSLLDQSFLPPPGEPPVFMYAPPPPTLKPQMFKEPATTSFIRRTTGPMGSSGSTISSSSSSLSKAKETIERATKPVVVPRTEAVVTTTASSSESYTSKSEALVITKGHSETVSSSSEVQNQKDVSGGGASFSLASSSSQALVPFRRRQDAPYIRPTKFVPVLDYFSSSSDREDQGDGGIKPKWKPGDGEEEQRQMSQWRKVTYVPATGRRRRDSLSSLVDLNMQEMNQRFKQNISEFSKGLCYNRMDRKIESDLSGVSGPPKDVTVESARTAPGTALIGAKGSVEDANPLIYFKYDFGYEFGIASPRDTTRASSEPPGKLCLPSSAASSTTRSTDDAPISLPIIHETTTNSKK